MYLWKEMIVKKIILAVIISCISLASVGKLESESEDPMQMLELPDVKSVQVGACMLEGLDYIQSLDKLEYGAPLDNVLKIEKNYKYGEGDEVALSNQQRVINNVKIIDATLRDGIGLAYYVVNVFLMDCVSLVSAAGKGIGSEAESSAFLKFNPLLYSAIAAASKIDREQFLLRVSGLSFSKTPYFRKSVEEAYKNEKLYGNKWVLANAARRTERIIQDMYADIMTVIPPENKGTQK